MLVRLFADPDFDGEPEGVIDIPPGGDIIYLPGDEPPFDPPNGGPEGDHLDRHRHQLRCFVAGKPEHQALVPSTTGVNALRNIW